MASCGTSARRATIQLVSSTQAPSRGPGAGLIEWGAFIVKFGVIVWVLLSMGGIWSLKVLSAGYQVIGALLALLGVAVIADWTERTAAAFARWARRAPRQATDGLARWIEATRRRLGRWWANRRGRPYPAYITGLSAGTSSAMGTLTVTAAPRPRPDPSAISDHDWIVRHEADIVDLLERAEKADKAREDQNIAFRQRLSGQANDLRHEIFQASRTGWPLVVTGLVFSGVGAAIGYWA